MNYIIAFLLLMIAVALYWILYAVLKLARLNSEQISEGYKESVQVQKIKKPVLPALKQKVRGRQITKTEDLVDIADLPWEEGYKVLEDLGNG